MALSNVLKPKWSLIDIGVNLTSEMYLGNYHHGEGENAHACDLDLVVQRAATVGVVGMLITGGNRDESRQAITLAQQYSNDQMRCMATVGCHPTRCSEFLDNPQEYFDALDALIDEHSIRRGGVVAAIGECGLDYDRLHFCPKDVQIPFFEKQFELARTHSLPMFLHNRNTNGDFVRMVRDNRSSFSEGVVHSFTGDKEELQQLLDLNLFIGINGCSLKSDDNMDVARTVPLDRLLIETDAPYCDMKNTHSSRGLLNRLGKHSVSAGLLRNIPSVRKEKFAMGSMVKSRNEPCMLVEVLEVLYELRKHELSEDNRSIEAFAAIIEANTKMLFGF